MKVLDLFSGIGGFSLGLERAGFETVAFVENNDACHRVLKKHWSDVPIYKDIKDVSFKQGFADVICGGFPCQDISLAGKGEGLNGERSGLWFEFHRLIKEIKPKYIIAENVAALRTRGLDKVLWSLNEVGYDAEWHCLPASAFGAPHYRDRVWIIGYPHNQPELQTNSLLDTFGIKRDSWKGFGAIRALKAAAAKKKAAGAKKGGVAAATAAKAAEAARAKAKRAKDAKQFHEVPRY